MRPAPWRGRPSISLPPRYRGPASRRHATTSFDVTKPSQPTKRRNICPVLPPSRLPCLVSRLSRPISSDAGQLLEELAKAAMFLRNRLHELCIIAHRHDLGAVAHDTLVGEQAVPEFVRLERQLGRLEAEEGFLEVRPLVFDDTPGKASQNTRLVISARMRSSPEFLQRLQVELCRQQLCQRFRSALALLGPGANGLEGNHGLDLFQSGQQSAISLPRSARLSTIICSLSVCASAPRTPRPSRVARPWRP